MDKDLRLQFTSSPMLYVVWLCLCLMTVRAQDGKVTCSVPPVEEFHDTVLTCHFPEDLSVSNKDFTVYHYRSNDNPEAVLDCCWIRGVRKCSTHPDFVYNNIVSRTLSITVRHVTTNHTGRYACQIANYEPRFLESCELRLKPGIENTCSINKEESQSSATLTCYFSEDIGKTQRNFTVVKYNGQDMTEVTKCWWVDGHNHCKFADGYINISSVSSYYTVLISEVKIEKEGNYSCWYSGSDTNQETCLLHLSDEEADEEQSGTILVTVLIPTLVGVAGVVAAAVVLFLTYRR
ncbi:uncharacterized protein LOC112575682 [Pomacea canaliculata]|uniref:uncharacterized protein LOC112575682 n=1 Tax=Pomacea canaliculata TaxID=400727 RepID=UPI000D728E7D|nr:uncharacterized protein LOC112575682 [Pomacea canaliculata]